MNEPEFSSVNLSINPWWVIWSQGTTPNFLLSFCLYFYSKVSVGLLHWHLLCSLWVTGESKCKDVRKFLSFIYLLLLLFVFDKGCLTVACPGLEFILYPCFAFELLIFLPLPLITGQWHRAQIFPKNFRYEAVNVLEILFSLTFCGAGGWTQALFLLLCVPDWPGH